MSKPSLLFRCAGGGAIVIGLSGPASATTINIFADKDTTIFQNQIGNSLGGGVGMFVGGNNASSPRRGLLEFDIAAAIPAGATINSVQLTLYLGQVAGGGPDADRVIELHRVLADWGEGTEGAGMMIGGTGQGFAAQPGSATWNQRQFGIANWMSLGGDFAPTASQTSLVDDVINVPYSWTTNAAMVADVQLWLNNPGSNFGWLLRNQDELGQQTFRAFFTQDNLAMVPLLTVDFTAPIPEPGTLSLLGLGLAKLLHSRRRRQQPLPRVCRRRSRPRGSIRSSP